MFDHEVNDLIWESKTSRWPPHHHHLAVVSEQNTSLSSLDDSFDQLDASESLPEQPLHKAHRGRRSEVIAEQKAAAGKKSCRDSLCPLVVLPSRLPSSDTSSKANGSAFRTVRVQPSDGSSSEELSASGETRSTLGWSGNITVNFKASLFLLEHFARKIIQQRLKCKVSHKIWNKLETLSKLERQLIGASEQMDAESGFYWRGSHGCTTDFTCKQELARQ